MHSRSPSAISNKDLPEAPPEVPPPDYAPPTPPRVVVQQHVCITINDTDSIRLINCPEATQSVIRQVMLNWPKGCQERAYHYGALEFKLGGYPFSDTNLLITNSSDVLLSRQLMSMLLANMFAMGWQLVASIDISKKQTDNDSLFFRTTNNIPRTRALFCSISFELGDRLRLIDAPGDLIQAVQGSLAGRIQAESWLISGLAYEFKLIGHPWLQHSDDAVLTPMLLLQLMDVIVAFGWELHTTLDMTRSQEGRDMDTWFLRKCT